MDHPHSRGVHIIHSENRRLGHGCPARKSTYVWKTTKECVYMRIPNKHKKVQSGTVYQLAENGSTLARNSCGSCLQHMLYLPHSSSRLHHWYTQVQGNLRAANGHGQVFPGIMQHKWSCAHSTPAHKGSAWPVAVSRCMRTMSEKHVLWSKLVAPESAGMHESGWLVFFSYRHGLAEGVSIVCSHFQKVRPGWNTFRRKLPPR